MKRGESLALLAVLVMLLWLFIMDPVVTVAEEDWFASSWMHERGCTLDGNTLVVPEGIAQLGFTEEESAENENLCLSDQAAVTEICLPSTLRVIGACAISGFQLEELVIPSGVESMQNCFDYMSIGRLVLPDTLREANADTFLGASIDEIVISPDNPYFCVQNGIVFTKDLKTLVYYPSSLPATHFDVPAGVTTIGANAFRGNETLQTVSLPLGLTSIERCAFIDCGRLYAISIPLTVTRIGFYAFCDCVSLQRVTLPKRLMGLLGDAQEKEALNSEMAKLEPQYDTPYADTVFENCPYLHNSTFSGDNGGTSAARYQPDTYIVYPVQYFSVIMNPKAVDGWVNAYRKVDADSGVRDRFACGTVLQIQYPEVTWQEVQNGVAVSYLTYDAIQGEPSYLSVNDVVLLNQSPLFSYADIQPRQQRISVYGDQNPLAAREKISIRASLQMECILNDCQQPWVWLYYVDDHASRLAYAFIGDFSLTREKTGDDKTFAVVIADRLQNRVHLRQKADKNSKSIAKYFSGSQLEILDSTGGFYQVRLYDGRTGYIMQDYVRIVPQAK